MPLKLPPRTVAVVAATAAAGLAGAAIAGAAGNSASTTSTTARQRAEHGAGETALTGATKRKVEAAALAKVPGGTIIRSETDNGGVYEAHVRTSDGTEVEVKVDKAFAVTAVETRPAGGPGGHHDHGGPHADLAAVAKALGVTEARLQKALDAARPDRGARGDFAAALAKALGESTADVQAVLDARHGRADGHHGPHGDDSAFVAALAKKFSISRAKARAALDAVHRAHEGDRSADRDGFYAAVAKALGKDAAAVKRAFEANRPTP